MLTDSQLFHLQDVLGCLACYANDLFGVLEPEQFMNLMDSDDPTRVDVVHEVLQTLWEHVDIIDTFVEKNPYGLNSADLQMALSWKDALHAVGVYAGTENGQELYLIEGRLVALEQAELHESGPCLVDITILPFEGILVEDYTSMAMDLDFAHASFPLRRDIALARSKGLIATPEQFLPFSREINQRRHEAEMEQLMADLDRESRLHAGEDISPEGFHRGKMSGLSRAERDEAAEQQARVVLTDEMIALMGPYSSPGPLPEPTLADCLAHSSKALMIEVGLGLGLPMLVSLTKTKHAERISTLVAEAGPELQDRVKEALWTYPSSVLRSLIAQVKDGQLVVPATPATIDCTTVSCIPFVFPFMVEGQLVGVLPQEFCDLLARMDLPEIAAQKEAYEKALVAVEDCVFCYGLLTLEEAYHELELLGLDAFSLEEFTRIVTEAIEAKAISATLWTWRGKDYLANLSIVPDQIITSAEEAELQEERQYLLDCQEMTPRKHLYEFAKDGRVDEALLTGEAAERLAAYLNERVPDGGNDLFFADHVLEELIYAVVEANAGGVDLLAIAERFGLANCDSDPQRLLGNIGLLQNSLPLWELNGWSAVEQMEMQTGRKLFFDDRGMPLKVGRNDPCPCGSGKPYKDCHGR